MTSFLNKIILLIILIGTITASLDYYLLINNQEPVFNIKEYNELKHVETYKSLFYIANRKTHYSNKEDINESDEINFIVLYFYKIKIKSKIKKQSHQEIKITKEDNCTDNQTIYYENDQYTIYTNCIESILVNKQTKELKEVLQNTTYDINTLIKKSLYLSNNDNIEKYQIDNEYNKDYIIYKNNNKYLITEKNKNNINRLYE